MSNDPRFLKACRLELADCTPVWFMRQAGRYMAEYRKLREKHTLLEICKTPELAVEVTMQPVQALGVDAAIIFADILLPLEGMGVAVEFSPEEGPVILNPVRTRSDVEALRLADPQEHLGFVLKSIAGARAVLNGKIPLIGFGGAPFTLASYMIEGGGSRNYLRTKSLMYSDPQAWDLMMSKLSDTLSRYLLAQVHAGAQAIQVFDSWVGCLGPADYRQYCLPHYSTLFRTLREGGVPTIHFGTSTADLLPLMREAGGDVMSIDWRTDLDDAWERIGQGCAIQGNLDPITLMAPWPLLKQRAQDILDRAAGRAGHIFNLGHGILPSTPVDAVKRLVDFVHEYSARA